MHTRETRESETLVLVTGSGVGGVPAQSGQARPATAFHGNRAASTRLVLIGRFADLGRPRRGDGDFR